MFRAEEVELIAKWRVRRGINAPLSLPTKAEQHRQRDLIDQKVAIIQEEFARLPNRAERNCDCKGKPQGCERRKCPRKRS